MPASRSIAASREPQRTSASRWISPALIGLPLAAAAVWWLLRYPAAPALTLALFAAGMAAFAVAYRYWAVLLLGLWPLMGWADWSGWLLVEESDFLLAACVVGGCLGRVWNEGRGSGASGITSAKAKPLPLIPISWMAWLALPALGAAIPWYLHEFAAPSTWTFQSAVHYHAPEAGLRLLKPYVWAAALALLYLHDHVADPRAAAHRVAWGMTWGLIACSLSVVLERWIYTGLMNFSSDYRATGPFWEMHVGGAALDIYLALALPLAVSRLIDSTRGVPLWVSFLAVALGLYSTVVTFSRATYVAVVLGILVTVWLASLGRAALRRAASQAAAVGARELPTRYRTGAIWLVLCAGLGTSLIFSSGGYRGVAAWLMCVVSLPFVLLAIDASRRRRDVSTRTALLIVTCIAAPVGWLLGELAVWIPKGVYSTTALLFGVLALMLRPRIDRMSAFQAWVIWAVWVMLNLAAMKVNLHWGEKAEPWVLGLSFFGLIWLGLALRRQAPELWPRELGWHLKTGLALCAMPLFVGMVLGGSYMQDRASTLTKDGVGRLAHWQQSLAVLSSEGEAFFGKGLSRYAQEFRLRMMGTDLIRPGHQQVSQVEGRLALMIQGADPSMGIGEQHRVIQRLPNLRGTTGPYVFEAQVWSPDREVSLKVELCGRHLLYVSDCAEAAVAVAPAPVPRWTPVRLVLQGDVKAWPAHLLQPQPVLSLLSQSGGQKIWLRGVQLHDGAGQDHVDNGQFQQGLDRWFFTSDRSHLPWSAKNMAVHLRVEQGWVGLLAWMVLFAAAVWRAVRSARAGSVTQAGLSGSLSAALVVAAIDSVVNHTRPLLLLLFLLLMSVSLMEPLRTPRRS